MTSITITNVEIIAIIGLAGYAIKCATDCYQKYIETTANHKPPSADVTNKIVSSTTPITFHIEPSSSMSRSTSMVTMLHNSPTRALSPANEPDRYQVASGLYNLSPTWIDQGDNVDLTHSK